MTDNQKAECAKPDNGKQGWHDSIAEGKYLSEYKGPYLVWDDTHYVWRLCHYVDDMWSEIRTGRDFPLRHTYYKELGIPEQVLPTKPEVKGHA